MKFKTVKDFANYALGDMFVKGFLFISLPLLSRVLDPEQYGKLSIINTAIMILYVFISLNLQNAVINRYMLTQENFGSYLKSVLYFLFPFQLMLLTLSPFFMKPLSALLGIEESDFFWVMGICILLSYIYIYTCYLQAARDSGSYVKINVISKVSEIVLIFIFAITLTQHQYLSKIYSQVIVSLILIIYVTHKFKKIARGNFDFKLLKEAVLFSVPLIIHVLSNSLLSQADRLIINRELGSYEAGLYSFAYNIGTGILVVIMAWNSSWQPRLYRLIEEQKIDKIKNNIYASTLVVFCISVVSILFSQEAIFVLADKKYYASVGILPLIFVGNALIHIYLIYVNFLFYKKHAMIISGATLIAVIFNIFLNYCLIPRFGIVGSAWATIASYFMLALMHYITSTWIIKNNVISGAYLIAFTAGLIVVYYLAAYINSHMSFALSLAIKSVITLFVAASIIKSGLHKKLSE
ncbi:lipopolysaccharide biosynthesis protein [Mixta hanseatica]|uniref:Oligosaccharide flippase family protein n=1 Tax=Mixta hanseatica TaxID=2872648 RepID=A0ABY4R8Y3_9GAMM|nr:oligosaccharide flippase family protein [Mixta hanseatica]UQY42859.1 oligosaccharide flippase family protein [Mixta hanseatica]